jgi:transposase
MSIICGQCTASDMAPNLAASTLELIHDIISSSELTAAQMAEAAGCSERMITRLRSNLRLFGSVKAPPNKGGRPRSLLPYMVQTLCDYLLEKPHLYLDEMAVYLWDEFETQVTTYSIRCALKYAGWLKKKAKQKARERNPDLRDEYFYFISDFSSDQLVFVDESGCDK